MCETRIYFPSICKISGKKIPFSSMVSIIFFVSARRSRATLYLVVVKDGKYFFKYYAILYNIHQFSHNIQSHVNRKEVFLSIGIAWVRWPYWLNWRHGAQKGNQLVVEQIGAGARRGESEFKCLNASFYMYHSPNYRNCMAGDRHTLDKL